MAEIGVLVKAAGTVVSAIGQARTANRQADVLEQQAVLQRQSAEFDIRRQRRENLRLNSKRMAQIGKSGAQVSGSTLDLLAAAAEEEELDIFAKRFNADMAEQRSRNQAKAARDQAKFSLFSGVASAGSSILTSNLLKAS